MLLALSCLMTTANPAFATSPDVYEGNQLVVDTSRVYDIDEVVVVDQPKETFQLRQQPLSSTAFGVSQLSGLGVRDLRDLSNFVPSFVMPQYGSRYTSAMYVRGIGSRVNSPAVGIYVDGMPLLNKAAFNFHTYSIDRADVLRGPQGTLYGMNTEGGLVRVFSKNPMNYRGTDVNLSLGKGLYRKVEVAHYARLSDKLGLTVAGFYDGQNGFFKNQADQSRADQSNEAGAKARLTWQATNRLSVDVLADYQFVRQYDFPYGLMVTRDMIDHANITSPYYNMKPHTEQPNTNLRNNYQRNMLNTGLGLKYAGQGFDFNSMTTWQFLRDKMAMDIDYLPQDFLSMGQRQLHNALTEELTLKSHNRSAWQWTVGAFGSYQWLRTDATVGFGNDMNNYLSQQITQYAYNGIHSAMAKRMAQAMIAQGMPEDAANAAANIAATAAIAKAGGCNIAMQLNAIPGLFRTPTFNTGVFHESNIALGSRFTATLGLRYDYSNVALDYATNALATLSEDVMGQHVDASVSSLLAHKERTHFSQLLPKIGLTYRFGAYASNVYALVSKGYRAGGYNIQMFSDILQSELQAQAQSARGDVTIPHDEAAYERIRQTIAYKPETSWNYEVGTHLNLFDNQLHVDLAAYYMQVHNQQLSVLAGNYGFGRMMVNAGKSHSCGLEASVRGAALDNKLSYGMSYGLTIAKFDEYADSLSDGTVRSYKHNYVPFVPMHTLAASADYRIDIDQTQMLPTRGFTFRSVTVGLNLTAQGQTYWDEANTCKQKFYALLGAHADADFGVCHVNLWMRNLSDTRYNTFAIESAATGTAHTFAQRGNPFQIGVDLGFRF